MPLLRPVCRVESCPAKYHAQGPRQVQPPIMPIAGECHNRYAAVNAAQNSLQHELLKESLSSDNTCQALATSNRTLQTKPYSRLQLACIVHVTIIYIWCIYVSCYTSFCPVCCHRSRHALTQHGAQNNSQQRCSCGTVSLCTTEAAATSSRRLDTMPCQIMKIRDSSKGGGCKCET